MKAFPEMIKVSDTVENSFSVAVPRDWHHQVYSTRFYDVHRGVVHCVSPQQDTMIFLGDSHEPMRWTPEYATPVTYYNANSSPMHVIEPYQPAPIYLQHYAAQRFGRSEAFRINGVADNPRQLQDFCEKMRASGHNFPAQAAAVNFSYRENGYSFEGIVSGVTSHGGSFWVTAVGGVCTTGRASDYFELLLHMSASMQTNPQWKAQQQMRHQQVMAQGIANNQQIQFNTQLMNAQHQQNMQNIQHSAQQHQHRMDAIHAMGEASNAIYRQNDIASDHNQRGFLNAIREENTVQGADGATYQVASGHQRYYVNRYDNTYLGGDINFDDAELRRRGFNPDDFEEVHIRR